MLKAKKLVAVTTLFLLLISPVQAATEQSIASQLRDLSTTLTRLSELLPSQTPQVLGVTSSQAVVFEASLDVDAKVDRVINLPHDTAYELNAGTVAVTFNSPANRYEHGIISKDGDRYGDGGHFTIYIKDYQVHVLFQSSDSEAKFSAPISTDTNHTVIASFSENGVAAYLDGSLIGADNNLNASWETNREYLQIGALGWHSKNQDSRYKGVFRGLLTNVGVYPSVLTPNDFAGTVNSEPPTEETTPPEEETTPPPEETTPPEEENTPPPEETTPPEEETAPPVVIPTDLDVYYSGSDLGWRAGEDVSNKLRDFIENVASPGDALVLEHMYDIKARAGTIAFPDDFMLAAVKGAGFNVRDTQSSPGDNIPYLFDLGNRNIINNVLVYMPDAPNTGTDSTLAYVHVDFHSFRLFGVRDNVDVTFYQTEIHGYINNHIVSWGERLTIQNSLFDGSAYALFMNNSNIDTRIHQSVFQNALYDGIKTLGSHSGTYRPVVTQSIFENMNRDGIDTTNGWAEGVIRDSIFRNNGHTAIDLKNHFKTEDHFDPDAINRLNRDILIEDNYFMNTGKAGNMVFTTNDRTSPKHINESNADMWLVKDVTIRNSTVLNPSDVQQSFLLIKDAHDITWENNKLYGPLEETKLRSTTKLTNTNYNLNGSNTTFEPARTFPQQTSYPFPFGQGDLTFDIPDPDVDYDPSQISNPSDTTSSDSGSESSTSQTRVITTANLNVRSTPNGTLLGLQNTDSLGTIIDPTRVAAGGYNWVYVDFDSAPDGWVADMYLSETLTSSNAAMTEAALIQQIEDLLQLIALLQAQLETLRAAEG